MKKCMEYEVEGARPRGRPKEDLERGCAKECQVHKLNRGDTMGCSRWQKLIKDD